MDDFLLKYYFNKKDKKVIFPKDKFPYHEKFWRAKDDDVSIAAAAITSEDTFDSSDVDPNNKINFKQENFIHTLKIESLFNLKLDIDLQNLVI